MTPSLKMETDIINVRSGPDTSFGLVGTANLGERFDIKGRNAEAAGTWSAASTARRAGSTAS